MKIKVCAAVCALLFLLPLFCGCGKEWERARCPIGEFDVEDVIEEEGGLRVTIKRKRISIEDENAELILITNDTDKAVNLDFVGLFYGEDGTRVKADQKAVNGFPAHYSGFVLFRPTVKYASCKLITTLKEHEGETPLQYVSAGYDLGLVVGPTYDWPRGYNVPIDDATVTAYNLEYEVSSSSDRAIRVQGIIIGFDSRGDPFVFAKDSLCISPGRNYKESSVYYSDRIWDDGAELPDVLLGDLYCIAAFDSAEWEDEYEAREEELRRQYLEMIEKQETGND